MSSYVHPLGQWNVWPGGELTICLCWWLHITVSCSQASDRPAAAASLNRDLERIQEWRNYCCIILNPNKTTALVVSLSRTVNPPHGDLVLSGVSICASPNLDILGCSWQQAHLRWPCAWYCLSCLSKNWYFEVGEECLCGHLNVASLLLCICSPNSWVLFSGVGISCWMSSLASRSKGVFGGLALPWSDFFVVVSSMSCCCTVYVVQG